jgi:transcriptional regulator with XRE-family HTH domain
MSTSENYMSLIQNNISKFRKLKGFTQQQLAELIGLSRSGLADIESGRNNVYADTLVKIANALQVPVTHFLALPNTSDNPEPSPSFRFLKRIAVIESFTEPQKKRIFKKLDEFIILFSKQNGTDLPHFLSDDSE